MCIVLRYRVQYETRFLGHKNVPAPRNRFWSIQSMLRGRRDPEFRAFMSIHKVDKALSFNWNHFEMRLLNQRINFYLLRTFCPHLGRVFFVLFLLSLRFGQISPFTATWDRNAESCNRIPSNYCLP